MKCKSIVAAGMLLFSFAASTANADVLCSLSVSNPYVGVGQTYSYGVTVNAGPNAGPLPPPPYDQPAPFTVVFYGSKNGVDDIGSGGETYPATVGFGYSQLPGYYNPGGYAGTYVRYAKIYSRFGYQYCTTNSVTVVLF